MKHNISHYIVYAALSTIALASCSDTDIIPDITPATCASGIELTVPAEYAQYVYTDATGTPTLPLIKGQTVQLGYTLTPADITSDAVLWASTAPDVATADGGNITAVSGRGLGYTMVTVSPVGMFPGSGVTSTLKVQVADQLITASAIALNADKSEVYEGEQAHLTFDIAPENATYHTLQWTSSDPAVASVDNQGNVTGVAVPSGIRTTTTITATAIDGSGTTATCDITVLKKVEPTDVALDRTTATCAKNEGSLRIGYTTTPAESTTSLLQWTSSDESVATVADGVVTFRGCGTATITATCPTTGKQSQMTLNIPAGLVRETYHNPDFYSFYNAEQSGNGTASSHKWHDGHITVTTYKQNATAERGDLKWWRTPITLNAGNYPILAVKMDDVRDTYKADGVTARNINVDCVGKSDSGKDYKALGGGNNKYTGDIKCSDGSHVFIYDLSKLAFGTGGLAPANESINFSIFQIKYADIKTIDHQIDYNVYWLQTFTSIAELKDYLTQTDKVTFEVIK